MVKISAERGLVHVVVAAASSMLGKKGWVVAGVVGAEEGLMVVDDDLPSWGRGC